MNAHRVVVLLLVVCAVSTAGGVPGGAAAIPADGQTAAAGPAPTSTLQSTHVQDCAATPPADHSDPEGNTSDVVGWVEGYWYNESVSADDGPMTQAELEELTKRTAARVEALRCLTYDELPPLESLTRDEWRTEVETGFSQGFAESDRQFTQAQLATQLYAGQAADPEEVLIEHQSGFPAAFYDTQEEYMGFITDNPDSIEVDEVTLAHELTHALQDQHYDVETVFAETTNDEYMSSLAVVEGDAELVADHYEENCGTWSDDCRRVSTTAPTPSNWGLAIQDLAAYNAPLVAHTYERDGWEGVNELLADPPESMVEALQPERHPEFERQPIIVLDRSNGDWSRVETPSGDYDIVGQHGTTAMLMAPTYESQGAESVVDPEPFLEPHVGGDLNYNHPVTEGWQNDRFYAYTNEAGEVGSVWSIAWENADQAATFAQAYEDLVAYRGGEPVDGMDGVYSLDPAPEYRMAVGVEQEDDRVWIVTAPTPADLDAVHDGFAAVPGDEESLAERVAELEAEVQELEQELDQRDERIQELEENQAELEQAQERVDELLAEYDLENLEELEERLEAMEGQGNNSTGSETDDDGNPLPGFGVGVAIAALVATAAIRRRHG